VVRGRPLSAVDFCMTLAALRELKAHGRVLMPDERFGLKILRSMHPRQGDHTRKPSPKPGQNLAQ